MTTDLDLMAARLIDDVDDLRCCVILSDDGEVLSATPAEDGTRGSEVWARFRELGAPRRGFVVMGDEVWAIVNHGERVGIAVAADTAVPGMLLERLEMLVSAARHVVLPVPAEVGAANGERASLSLVPGQEGTAPEAQAAAEGGTDLPGFEPDRPRPDPNVDPMTLVREFAWLQEDRRTSE